MKWLYCVDASGLEGILERGIRYLVRPLPCGTVAVGELVFSASRFSEGAP